MDIDALKALAEQLRKPEGDKGIEVADMMNESNINMTYHSIDRLSLSNHDIILELGHGNCKHLPYILEQNNTLTYFGLDISQLMHDEAKRIHQHAMDNKRASFFLYDGKHIPFGDEFFTKIFTVNTLYFWTDPKLLLMELFRILKPNGIVNITFGEEESMKNLPFTAFGFTLYSTEKLQHLIRETPFTWMHADTKTEMIKNKMGHETNRTFTTVSLKK
jgi:SAM-dependent methyltransferase